MDETELWCEVNLFHLEIWRNSYKAYFSLVRTMNVEMLNILHIIPSVSARSFGLGPVSVNLAHEQNLQGIDSNIWCLDPTNDVNWASESVGLSPQKIRRFIKTCPELLNWSFEMERAAAGNAHSHMMIVHQHGIWSGISRVTNILRKKHHISTVVAPHGSLENWALKKSIWKKRLALIFYERDNLNNATCLHACSEQEVAGFRDFGLTNPIAVIPNGINNKWIDSTGNAKAFRDRFGIPLNKRIMLFLSRISPVKGILLLLDALKANSNHLDDWLLVIAGSDEFNHMTEVAKKIQRLNLGDNVYFTGLLVDQAKRDAFAAAELFVLPSKKENYGIVVAEALGAGVPVLTTKGTPWEDLVNLNCGWWVDVDAGAIAVALNDALARSREDLCHMGAIGKKRAATEYTWKRSAQMTIELYEWILGWRRQPEFVVID